MKGETITASLIFNDQVDWSESAKSWLSARGGGRGAGGRPHLNDFCCPLKRCYPS